MTQQADEQREAMTDLHNAIMNLPCTVPSNRPNSTVVAYKIGHRDARHATAELALAAALPPAAVQPQPSDRELHLTQQAVVGNAWRLVALRVAFNKFKTLPPPEAYEWSPQQVCDWMMNEGTLTAGNQGGGVKQQWDDAGNPLNLEAAADDAVQWLNLLARNAAMLRMPLTDVENLRHCRASLREFLAGANEEGSAPLRIAGAAGTENDHG